MRWFLLILCVYIHKCTPKIIITRTTDLAFQIAGIFESSAITQLYAFNETMNYVHGSSVRLNAIVIQPQRADSYSMWRNMCANKAMRPVAIFGPQNPYDGAIRDQCAIANIPHLQATWQPFDPDLEEKEEEEEEEPVINIETNEENENQTEEKISFKKISINYYPDSDEISIAYSKLLKFYKWKNFAILYEDNFGLLRVQKILAEQSDIYPVTVHRLDPDGDNRKIFKRLNVDREDRILLDCHVDRVLNYMTEATNFKKLDHYQHYILTTLDASTIADSLVKKPINITWLSLTEHQKLHDPKHNLATRVGRWTGPTPDYSTPVIKMKTDELIMDDIANHVVKAFETIENVQKPENHVCEDEIEPWSFGAQLQKAILETKTVGATGNIEFDQWGKRINYVLYVNEIYLSNRQTVGRWESNNATAIIETSQNRNGTKNQKNKHFIVIAVKAKPYFFDKQKCIVDDDKCEEENADEFYEGFSVDLVKAIFDLLKQEKQNYTYEFSHNIYIKTGTYDKETKKWTDLIGDLLDKKADLAIGDVSITEERKKVVDFSVPFMSLGISILYTQERKLPPGKFSFLYPYTVDVWMYTATAYCVVSIILFVCSRISPADWENPEPCEKNPVELENIWTFKNCAWLTMGSIMTQGCDILPKAIGTRWVCGMWWFFAMIVCQTYIAQLSASMTSALENEPVNSVEDLAKQNKILYGAIKGGSTLDFFRTSKDQTFQRMHENMMANPAVLVNTNDEGVKRVLNGKNRYAFLMESCAIEYKLKRNCDLKKVGGELDSKYYGIAMPANSPFRSDINRAILKLQESTVLDNIKKKWWDKKYGAVECPPKTDINDVEGDLEMENLIGAFLVLLVGLVFGLLITAAEFLNEVRNIVVREQVTHKEVIVKELKASLNFFQLQKPVLRNPSRAASLASSSTSENEERTEKQAIVIENFLDFEKQVQ